MSSIKITTPLYWVWRAQSNTVIDNNLFGGVRAAVLLTQLLFGAMAEKQDALAKITSNAFDVEIFIENKERRKEFKWLLNYLNLGDYPQIQISTEKKKLILGRLLSGIMQGSGVDAIARKLINDLMLKKDPDIEESVKYIIENSTSSAVYIDFRIKWLTAA